MYPSVVIHDDDYDDDGDDAETESRGCRNAKHCSTTTHAMLTNSLFAKAALLKSSKKVICCVSSIR